MRIYFLSASPAALKLNGAYMGIIDCFERFADFGDDELKRGVFAEAIPQGASCAVGFIIKNDLFKDPPDFIDLYLTDGDAVVFIKKYPPAGGKLEVLAQHCFKSVTATLFTEGGGIYLNCVNGASSSLYELSASFKKAEFTEHKLCGFDVLVLAGEGCIAVISDGGKRVFYNPAESWSCGDTLTVTVNFNTCAMCKAECRFIFDGEKMTLKESVTRECAEPSPKVFHFAFFESVLTKGDFKKYLCPELCEKADALPSFLGEFIDVTIPYSRFFEKHGDILAAGLVYPAKRNLFEVKYFAVELTDGKISNIFEVEN